MINDTTKPLVFLGTNCAMWNLVDTAKQLGIPVAGIIDDDYHGAGEFQSLPILALESELQSQFWNDYQFFCATSWQPDEVKGPWHTRNRSKRHQYIDLLDSYNLDVATIVHPLSTVVSYKVDLGRGVYVDHSAYVGSNSSIGDYTMLWYGAGIAHDNMIGRNCVIQRYSFISGGVQLQDDVYMGLDSSVVRDDAVISTGTFIHPGISLMRGTSPGEVVSLAGKDLRKVYHRPTEG
jgi:carbonic anhydrase/acetyltransferase-like protein (isoleucine patch superfamily)